MTSLNPADIFTKLWALAAIIFSLFGAMHILAAVAMVHDRRFQEQLLRLLRTSRYQFEELASGAWVWHVVQDSAREDVGHLGGPFADMCKIIGAPMVRLRMAIPEEILSGDVGAFLSLLACCLHVHQAALRGWQDSSLVALPPQLMALLRPAAAPRERSWAYHWAEC